MAFGKTKNHRLTEVINFTDTCPEMAPPGWHLYLGWGLPTSHNGDFDSDAEISLLIEDMREAIPGFSESRILSTSAARGDWPAQHALSGTDVRPTTPIPNLWNVGDGVKNYGDGGMEGVAKVAREVVEEVLRAHAPTSARQ
jgi:phytoene dehydrogenase-like protein